MTVTDKPRMIGLTGDHAVAEAVKLCKPDVVPAYPITPQTIIVERYSDYVADGEVHTEFITVESEHSAMSACIGASSTGARVFTASASAGIMFTLDTETGFPKVILINSIWGVGEMIVQGKITPDEFFVFKH